MLLRSPAARRHYTLARSSLRGQGIEIGALHNPLPMPHWAAARYVDRMSVANLRRQSPDLRDKPLVQLDILDDGEKLGHVGAGTQDFVTANHFLDHCQDVIGTLGHLLRMLRPGGVLYAALPDKRFIFDSPRAVTSLEHLRKDHREEPEASRRGHFENYARAVQSLKSEDNVRRVADEYEQDNYSIHFHVRAQKEMLEFFLALIAELGFKFEAIVNKGEEVNFVLRKAAETTSAAPRAD
jgi:predicted SAM-dependent methyltransferase